MAVLLGNLGAILIAVAAFIVTLSIIVFIHEYGHFKVARLCGIKVDVFSIGFGKTLLRRSDKHGTEWRVSALPLGGYVKFFGDAGPASNPDRDMIGRDINTAETAPREAKAGSTQFPKMSERDRLAHRLTEEEKKVCFHFKPIWQRMAVVAAGPIANFILAITIFTGLVMVYGEQHTDPILGEILPDTAASEAGLIAGDTVQSINGRKVSSFRDISRIVQLSSNDQLSFQILRQETTITLPVKPRRTLRPGPFGTKKKVGFLGVQSATGASRTVKYGFFGSLKLGTLQVQETIATTLKFMGRLVRGKEDVRELGGPVKIADMAGRAAKSGFVGDVVVDVPFSKKLEISLVNAISLCAAISVSIGFLNLLPVPVLDGGHLMFYAYEAVARKPLDEKIQAIGFRIGLVMLGALMIFVFFNDITQLMFPET